MTMLRFLSFIHSQDLKKVYSNLYKSAPSKSAIALSKGLKSSYKRSLQSPMLRLSDGSLILKAIL